MMQKPWPEWWPFPAQPRPLDVRSVNGAPVIAVLAPHPDDFDAIALTLRHFHRQGADIHLAVLTTGASGVEDGYQGAVSDAQKAALREAEQQASCAFFGLPAGRISFLRLPPDADGHLSLDAASHARIHDFLAACRPQLVFMPHGSDSNVTHQRTYALFRAVTLAAGWPLWAWLNQDAKTLNIRTDLYLPFDEDDAAWKGELLRLHRSQHQRNLDTRGKGFDARVLEINRKASVPHGAAYAELFELGRYG